MRPWFSGDEPYIECTNHLLHAPCQSRLCIYVYHGDIDSTISMCVHSAGGCIDWRVKGRATTQRWGDYYFYGGKSVSSNCAKLYLTGFFLKFISWPNICLGPIYINSVTLTSRLLKTKWFFLNWIWLQNKFLNNSFSNQLCYCYFLKVYMDCSNYLRTSIELNFNWMIVV